MEPGTAEWSWCWQASSSPMLNPCSSPQPARLRSVRTALPRRIRIHACHCLHLPAGMGGEWGMAVGVGCWIPHGRRAQAGAACTQGRAGGGEGQSQALVPHFDLQPTCSCRDEDRGFKSAPSWHAVSHSSALLCCACWKHWHKALCIREVFRKNALIYPHVTPLRKVNILWSLETASLLISQTPWIWLQISKGDTLGSGQVQNLVLGPCINKNPWEQRWHI